MTTGLETGCALLTGNATAAWAARLADVDYVPAFPITPQTEIIESLAAWSSGGEIPARVVNLDSEHSMITAAGAAAATGCRAFTATSSQGLLYAMEALYTVAGWRVPFVLVNVSRGLAAPITLEPDHNDILAARDSGCIQIHAETCQEVLDSILMGYRIAEDPRVRLPVIVNMDGFYLSFTREPVALPDPARVRAFLPAFDPGAVAFRASRPIAQGVGALGGPLYTHFRHQAHLAARNALTVHEEVATAFELEFGRSYDVIERYQMDDAEYVLVMAGSFATKAKAAIHTLRARGRRVGLLRLRLIRPWPAEAIRRELAGRRAAAVIDQNISPGLGGILFQEVAATMISSQSRPGVMRSFVGGLGGKDISPGEFMHVVDVLENSGPDEPTEPELLYTEADWSQIHPLLVIAQTPDRHSNEEAAP
ncbi:MAG: pyruvate synthase [Planctomycetes bacterium]|nr:pyruvate synthase [Planctomycetota bacterium]